MIGLSIIRGDIASGQHGGIPMPKTKFNKLVYLVFILTSCLLFTFAALYKAASHESIVPDIFKDVGIVVLSLALVNIIWNVVGGEPLANEIEQLKAMNMVSKDASVTGLTHIYASTAAQGRRQLIGWI
jgi:hypothetical protein